MASKRVRFFVREIAPDPAQYKPYSPLFEPVPALVLELEVDEKLILEEDTSCDDGVVVVGPEGFQAILVALSTMIKRADREFQSYQRSTISQRE